MKTIRSPESSLARTRSVGVKAAKNSSNNTLMWEWKATVECFFFFLCAQRNTAGRKRELACLDLGGNVFQVQTGLKFMQLQPFKTLKVWCIWKCCLGYCNSMVTGLHNALKRLTETMQWIFFERSHCMHLRLTSEHRSLENNSVCHPATPNVLKSSLDLVKQWNIKIWFIFF